jgi:hypothetical protein
VKGLLAFLCAVGVSVSAPAAEKRPELPLEKAVALAADYLKSIGQDKDHWIASVSYERESITSGSYKWNVKWGPPIQMEGRKELGLEISMTGELSRAVDKKATSK